MKKKLNFSDKKSFYSLPGVQTQMGCEVINLKGQLNFPKCHLHKRESTRELRKGDKKRLDAQRNKYIYFATMYELSAALSSSASCRWHSPRPA